MTTKKFNNVLGVTDPLNIDEYRLSVSAAQHTKANLFAFNHIADIREELASIWEKIESLSESPQVADEAETPRKAPAKKASAKKVPTKRVAKAKPKTGEDLGEEESAEEQPN